MDNRFADTFQWHQSHFFIREEGKSVLESQVEALFAYFQENTQYVLFVKDKNHHYVRVNQEFEKMMGRSKEEILGKTDYDMMPELEARHYVQMDLLVMQENKTFQLEESIYYPDGVKHYFDTVKMPLVNDAGEIIGILGVSLKIDDKKELIKTNQYHETYVEELIQGIDMAFALHEMIYDDIGRPVDYKYLRVNKTFTELFGLTEADVVGKTVKEILPNTEDYWIQTYNGVATSGTARWYDNYSAEFDRTFSVYAFSPKNGQFGVLIHDISDQKRYEERLFREKEHAEEISQAKDLFLKNLSHELRTPLNGIAGVTELLKTVKVDEVVAAYITILDHAVKGMVSLLEDIFDYAKIINNQETLLEVRFDVKELIEEVTSLYDFDLNQKRIGLEIEYGVCQSPYFYGDRIKLKKVINHLLSNAIKFTSSGKVRIQVTCDQEANKQDVLIIRIQDTGVGISEEQQKTLFKRIEQGDSSYSKQYGGIGLGLVTVSELMALMKGTIAVDSSLGQGSTFTLKLPMPWLKDQGCRSILIVEDDHVSAVFIEMIIKHLGFDAIVCESGETAMDAIKLQPFDLILMDLNLPKMDGFETTIAIREFVKKEHVDIPIIAITGFNSETYQQRAQETGMNAFIVKPVDVEILKAVIGNYLNI